ncbi:MAG: extracellular solute-binding protein [Bacilli bacterium]|jgi:spermidine/putrescine transport system substrate-binding protein|nr:extracellular solute-binding protein [Bacilli bacterium]
MIKRNSVFSLMMVALSAALALGTNSLAKPAVALKAATKTLRIYNWEDYMYEPEDGDTESPASLVNQFKDYYAASHPGETVDVVYDTFSTNEEMYNIISLGKAQYDLIAPSDYMIQRMIRENMLEKYTYTDDEYTNIPNYSDFGSPYLLDIFKDAGWSEYAVGYMWGTLGLIYNPAGVDDSLDIQSDMQYWNSLWSSDYKNKISIKDSMRDTYFVGITRVYKDELETLAGEFKDGTITKSEYNASITEIFNRADDATITKVGDALTELKSNIYGLEVDSGKNDIVTGKIAINTAWSGDAVYSMNTAEEENNVELYYSIPEEGANIWFDGWVMPKGADTDLAQEFLNFISAPDKAALNMEWIGYTPFIAGDEILSLVHDWYDAAAGDENAVDVDLSYFFDGTISDAELSTTIRSDKVNRQLTAQYPSEDEIARCAVMKDFGAANDKVIEMWANFKATKISALVYVAVGVVLVGGVGAGVFFAQKKKKSKRHSRKKTSK